VEGAVFALVAILLAACTAVPGWAGGGRAPADAPGGNRGNGGAVTAVGPGISIDDAMKSNLNRPLLVNGALVARGGEARLCSALAESYPPQCAGTSLKVEGLDLSTVKGLQSANGVTWSDNQVQLLGRVRDGVLTIERGAGG
jgi:hypothetical protein